MMRTTILLAALFAFTLAPRVASAQPARDARLTITVVDTSNAVIPGATVTVSTYAAKTTPPTAPVKTDPQGTVVITGLDPGVYDVQAEFPGFETRVLKQVRIRPGDNKHVMVLSIQGFQDTVKVGRDARDAAADPKHSFGSALTREQIDALSDDPDEMAQQLQDMAGQGAILRVDSFEGGKLPPKAQIKSIHITRDSFAAENHNANSFFIDIITQPGSGPLRGGGNYRLRDDAFSARNPFTPVKGAEQSQNYGMNFGGSLKTQKSSFSLGIFGTKSYDTPNLNVALPGGTRAEALQLHAPRDNMFANALFDYALTKDQTLRVSYNAFGFTNGNQGVGGYDLPERAYSTDDRQHTIRIQEAGPLGRRFFMNSRLQIIVEDMSNHSTLEARTIRVNDDFTSGGAQVAGGRHTRTLNLASDLDYVRGIHSVRAGLIFDGGSYRSDTSSNYLGTYTFASLADFDAGIPLSFTRRIGDPNVSYFNLQASAYLQDDIRVRKGLTLSPGVRYEAQTHLSDFNNFGPRFGVTWAPTRSGHTTLRASAGIFYDWLNANIYEQTLQVNGFRQQELNIFAPSYPDPGNIGLVPPSNKYLLGPGLQMPRSERLSVGIDQTVSPRLRVSVAYADTHGSQLLRGLNLNPVVNGARADAAFGNIVQVTGDARSHQRQVTTNMNVSLLPPTQGPPKERFNWRRLNFNATYLFTRFENDTDGAFSVPATGSLDAEWGPAGGDVRNRVFAGINSQALRNLNVNLNFNAASAPPYTIRTGRDDNGDLIFNDRPLGIGRNTARADGQWTLNGNFNYTLMFGQKKVAMPPGIMINGGGAGGPQVTMMAPQAAARYRLGIVVNVQNLTNHINYSGFSGTLTSPFYGVATSAQGMRKVDVGLNFNF